MHRAGLLIQIHDTVLMELDRKIRYAVLAVGVASLVLAGIGLHVGAHFAPLEKGGVVDRASLHG